MKLISILVATMTLLTACNGFYGDKAQSQQSVDTINTQSSSVNSIVGEWVMTNPPKKNMSVEITFNSDGSFRIYGKEDVSILDSRIKDIRGNWSKNGENIYMSTPGESEVGIMEILSLDNNSLVAHFKGEPEKEIIYLSKK